MYLWKLRARFERHPATGELEGVGLKHFPDVEARDHRGARLSAP
jgi:hypothetical protein